MKALAPAACLAALVLLALAGPLQSQQQNGCPDGEFTMDGCVMCVNMQPPRSTGHKGRNGEPCFTCLGVGGNAVVPKDPDVDGCVIMPVSLASFLPTSTGELISAAQPTASACAPKPSPAAQPADLTRTGGQAVRSSRTPG